MDQSDRDISQWDARLKEQVKRSFHNYYKRRIDLSVARDKEKNDWTGEIIIVEKASSADAIATVRLMFEDADELDLQENVEIKCIFNKVYISNAAQADAWLDIIAGINFEYKKKIDEAEAEGNGLSMLPKTGQVVLYRAGDDGDLEHGWSNGARFVPETIEGDDIVKDFATNLMWPADGAEAGCYNGSYLAWNNAIDYCNALDFAGFEDWFLPNIKQLVSIAEIKAALSPGPLIQEPPFANTVASNYQSSTTCTHITTRAYNVKFDYFAIQDGLKTGEMFMRACRLML